MTANTNFCLVFSKSLIYLEYTLANEGYVITHSPFLFLINGLAPCLKSL